MPTRPAAAGAAAELDDLTLRRAQRGEDAACRVLVSTYQRAVFAILSRMLGRRGSVEDLAQDTFLRVFRALPRFEPAGAARLSSWILTIATRLALDELRKRPPPQVELSAGVEVADERASGAVERRALGRSIAAAAMQLTPEQRAVFLLRELHDLDYQEIAHALQIDVGTVKSRLSRARQALREALGEKA